MESDIPFLLTVEFDGGPELKRTAARLQITARKYGFKPVWLVGVNALAHAADLEPMARWQAEGEAEIGAWLLASDVPPLVELGPSEGLRPALTDFPESVIEEKLVGFTDTLERATGRRPVTIRTYGLRSTTATTRFWQNTATRSISLSFPTPSLVPPTLRVTPKRPI